MPTRYLKRDDGGKRRKYAIMLTVELPDDPAWDHTDDANRGGDVATYIAAIVVSGLEDVGDKVIDIYATEVRP